MKLNEGNDFAASFTGREAPFFPGNTVSLCNADAWQPGMTKEQYDERAKVSQAVFLADAPRVKAMYSSNRMVGISVRNIDGSVDPRDLTYYVTWLGDILYSDPPLSEQQLYAVKRLNRISTDDIGLQTAHWNGIHDDATVLRLASYARQYRDRIMFPKGKPGYIEFQ